MGKIGNLASFLDKNTSFFPRKVKMKDIIVEIDEN